MLSSGKNTFRNYLMFRTDDVPEDTNSWGVIWEDDQLAKYKGKISIYDDSIFIADAALWLKATQPDLGIDNPYQLTQEQFDAAVALLKKQAPNAPLAGPAWPVRCSACAGRGTPSLARACTGAPSTGR